MNYSTQDAIYGLAVTWTDVRDSTLSKIQRKLHSAVILVKSSDEEGFKGFNVWPKKKTSAEIQNFKSAMSDTKSKKNSEEEINECFLQDVAMPGVQELTDADIIESVVNSHPQEVKEVSQKPFVTCKEGLKCLEIFIIASVVKCSAHLAINLLV